MIITILQLGFDDAIKDSNDKVFTFLFLVHSHGIVVSHSLFQYHILNKAAEFDFRS